MIGVTAADAFGATTNGVFSVRVAAVNESMFEVVRVAGDIMGGIADTYVNGDQKMTADALRVYNAQSMVVTVALAVTDVVADTDMTPDEIMGTLYGMRGELASKGVTDTAVLAVVVGAYDLLHGFVTPTKPSVNPDTRLTLK